MNDLTTGLIITLFLIIIIGTFLFLQKIENIKDHHLEELLEALSIQQAEAKQSYGNVIANINRVYSQEIQNMENDFLQKIRMLEYSKDNILTNYENNIPILYVAVERASNARDRTPMPDMIKSEDKIYHNEGMVFSYSDHNELSYGKVYDLLRTEVAKWLIENQMVFGRYNINSRQVEFRLRYLHSPV